MTPATTYFDRRALWLPLGFPALLAVLLLAVGAVIKEPTTLPETLLLVAAVVAFAPLYYGLPYLLFLAAVYRKVPSWPEVTVLRTFAAAPFVIAAVPTLALLSYSGLEDSTNLTEGFGAFFLMALLMAYAYALATFWLGRWLARRSAAPTAATVVQA